MLPQDFDPKIYKLLNPDLQLLTIAKLKKHFVEHGIQEGRKYKLELPINFNSITYKKLNTDLTNMNEEELAVHFMLLGSKENREYTITTEFIKKIVVNEEKVKSCKLNNIEKYTQFSTQDLKCASLNAALTFNFDNKKYNILKTFLISKDNKSDVQLLHYSNDFIFIADVTNYCIEAIFDNNAKILYITKANIGQRYKNSVILFYYLVDKYKELFSKHIQNTEPVKYCTFTGVKQIMHHYINEMAGIWNLLSELDVYTIFSYFEYYGEHEKVLLPFLNKTVIERNKNFEELFVQTCTENLFFVKRSDTRVPKELTDRIKSQYTNETLNIFNNYNKCVLFTVRTTHRKLKNQVGFIATCIKQIEKKYPNSIYLIDGITQLHKTELSENSELVLAEKKIFQQLCERIPTVRLHSLLFLNFESFIQHVKYVDYYISHIGTCQHKLGYFSNARGVVHGGGESIHGATKNGWYWLSHFGEVCQKIDNNCFEYDDIQNYNSNYTARLDLVSVWAQTITI